MVVPINKRSKSVEGLDCISDLKTLTTNVIQGMYSGVSCAKQIGVSIITGPGVTKGILEEGYKLGIRNFFLQPGTYDSSLESFVVSSLPDAKIVKGCVLVDHRWIDTAKVNTL